MRLVASSAIAGGAFTSVLSTATDSRSIIADGASRYPMRIPGAMLFDVLVMKRNWDSGRKVESGLASGARNP